jgi:hypothetical protein
LEAENPNRLAQALAKCSAHGRWHKEAVHGEPRNRVEEMARARSSPFITTFRRMTKGSPRNP